MTYENNHCPACGKAFTAQDDIVVCPECGTPHHRGCWHALGACANSALHGDYTWQPEFAAQDEPANDNVRTQPCPRCGRPCDSDALTCPHCGQQLGMRGERDEFAFNSDVFLRGIKTDPSADLGGITVRDASMLVQYRVPDYVRKFGRTGKTGWNWAAFFFSPFWFFYRKIYKAGALFLGILMVCSVFLSIPVGRMQDHAMEVVTKYITIDENSTPEQITSQLASLNESQQQQVQQALVRISQSLLLFAGGLMIPNIAAALVADSVYKKKLIRDAESLHEFAENDKTFRMLALRRGGVSVLGLVGCYLVVSVFFNLILTVIQV